MIQCYYVRCYYQVQPITYTIISSVDFLRYCVEDVEWMCSVCMWGTIKTSSQYFLHYANMGSMRHELCKPFLFVISHKEYVPASRQYTLFANIFRFKSCLCEWCSHDIVMHIENEYGSLPFILSKIRHFSITNHTHTHTDTIFPISLISDELQIEHWMNW